MQAEFVIRYHASSLARFTKLYVMDPSVPRRWECVDAIFTGDSVSRLRSCPRLGICCLGLTVAKTLGIASRDCLHRLGGAFT